MLLDDLTHDSLIKTFRGWRGAEWFGLRVVVVFVMMIMEVVRKGGGGGEVFLDSPL